MSTRYHDKFFDQATPQSLVKLRIYRTYLVPWAAKLGSNPANRRLWIVDGFAGRGRYKDGTPGSPELAMALAKAAVAEGRRYRVQCIFGETRPGYQAILRDLRGLYPEASPMIIEDDFWDRTNDIVDLVSGEPSLVFIDPFGLAGLRFERLTEMVNRLGKVDLIVNLRTPAIPRLAPAMRERVSRAIGSDDWTIENVSDVFRRNLISSCGFRAPASLQIKERLHGRLHTELILASRAVDAYELWNDAIVKEVERSDASNAVGDSERSRDLNIELIARRLSHWSLARGGVWRRQDAVDWHVVEYCGDAHTGTIRRAHQLLVGKEVVPINPQAGIEERRFRRLT